MFWGFSVQIFSVFSEGGGGGEFRLKEIVFYNLFIYLFDIFEILIMKIKYFSKVYKERNEGMETFFD